MALPYFMTGPLQLFLFYTVFVIWAVPELLGSFSQRSRGDSSRKDRGSFWVLIATLTLSLAIALIFAFRLPAARMEPGTSVFFALGIVLILTGAAIRWYAMRVLGRFFTRDIATQSGQEVVQEGPYRLVRHPAYTGTLITLVGVGLALTNWASLIAMLVVPLAGYLYRISVEERLLQEALGEPYRVYMQKTRRLIPYIW